MSLDSSILTGFDVSDEDVQSFTSSNVGLYGIDISRISRFLLVQLTSAWKHRTMSTFSVTDVLQSLEGVNPNRGSSKPRPFRGSALSGLWKVHFIDPRFLVKNIYNEWGMFSGRSNKFAELCMKVARKEQKQPLAHGWQGRLAHEFVIGGYERRARKNKMTGEWLIFGIQNKKNVYLALCKHSEGPEQDRSIYDGLKGLCGAEFPELFLRGAQSTVQPEVPVCGRPRVNLGVGRH